MKVIKCRKTALIVGEPNEREARLLTRFANPARRNQWAVPLGTFTSDHNQTALLFQQMFKTKFTKSKRRG